MRTIDLSGKNALVLGVANQRSLAWAIAEALGDAGARLALTYQGERLQDKVHALSDKYPDTAVMACDVTSDYQVDAVMSRMAEDFKTIDYLIHSVAFAPREALEKEFHKTTVQAWRTALEVSAYSLVDLTNRALPLMQKNGGSILALTYMASQRVVPNYNVMGSAKAALEHCVRQLAFELGPNDIRVNAISAGPIATLSARGISGFSKMATHHRKTAPLGRSIEPKEVGNTALFLCSDLASGITGEIVHVDAGYSIMAG